MPRLLSGAEARLAFDDLAQALPKQHLRLPFRKRFGTGELIQPDLLKKGIVVAPRDRPVTNLLQEVPDALHVTRIVGAVDNLQAVTWSTGPAAPIGDLLSPEEVEQGLIVQGRKAKVYVYSDPTEDAVYSFRVSITEPVVERKPLSRRERARLAGKTPPPRSKRPRGRR